jgi:hypothetical protein
MKSLNHYAKVFDMFCKGVPIEECTPELEKDADISLIIFASLLAIGVITMLNYFGITDRIIAALNGH